MTTRRARLLLKGDLLDRWASVIEEDVTTEGFWIDVAKIAVAMGHHVDAPLPADLKKTALQIVRETADSLRLKAVRATEKGGGL